MPFNGSGVYSLPLDWNLDAANGVPITSSRMMTQQNDQSGAFNICVTRDGQGSPSADIPWNSHKITGLAVATTTGDALSYGNPIGGASTFTGLISGDATYSFSRSQKTTTIAQSTTVDVLRFLSTDGSTVLGNNFVVGTLYINAVDEGSGTNNTSAIYCINTTGNGVTNSSIDDYMLYASGVAGTPSAVQRGVQLIASFTLAADGVGGAVKVQVNTSGSGKTVTVRATFIGMVK